MLARRALVQRGDLENRGEEANQRGEYEQAAQCYRDAFDESDCPCERGMILWDEISAHLMMGDVAAAEARLTSLAQFRAQSADSCFNAYFDFLGLRVVSRTSASKEDHLQGLEAYVAKYEQVLQGHPDTAALATNVATDMAFTLAGLGRFREAIPYLLELAKDRDNPNLPEVIRALALCHQRLGEHADAERAAREALRLGRPSLAELRCWIAYALYNTSRPARALFYAVWAWLDVRADDVTRRHSARILKVICLRGLRRLWRFLGIRRPD